MEQLATIHEPDQTPEPACINAGTAAEQTPSEKPVNVLYQQGMALLDDVSKRALNAGPGYSTTTRRAHAKALKKFSDITAKLVEQDRENDNGLFTKIEEALKTNTKHGSWAEMIQENTLAREREPNEIDLFLKLRELLEELQYPRVEELMDAEHMRQAKDANSQLQRVLINRMLMLLCQDYPDDTRMERYCLTNVGDMVQWLESLKTTVIPRLIALGIL